MTEPTNLHALLGDRYDAVIEKATLALYASSGCSDWPEVVDPERAYWLGDAAATITAVLPDLLAEAWAAGYEAAAGDFHDDEFGLPGDRTPNPYRTEETDHA